MRLGCAATPECISSNDAELPIPEILRVRDEFVECRRRPIRVSRFAMTRKIPQLGCTEAGLIGRSAYRAFARSNAALLGLLDAPTMHRSPNAGAAVFRSTQLCAEYSPLITLSSVNQAGARQMLERGGERAIFLAVSAGERRDLAQMILRLIAVALFDLPQTVMLSWGAPSRVLPQGLFRNCG
jgi:hypothetical protein